MGGAVKAVTNVVKSVGGALGIGGGNTPRYDPSRFAYHMDEKAFGKTNEDIAREYGTLSDKANANVEGIDQRQSRSRQTALADALEAQARGEGPSLAENQLRQANERSLANQLALAASTRGRSNPAATARQVLQNQAQNNQVTNAQVADARIQEQLNAQQMLGNLSTQLREQDAAAQNNAISQNAQFLAERAGIADANRAAAMNLETTRANQAIGVGNQAVQDTINRRDTRQSTISGLLQGGGGGLGMLSKMSDKNAKSDIKDGSEEVYDFLEALNSKVYKYKEPEKHGSGKEIGVLAQDVERGGNVGKSLVKELPEGKVLDMGKGFGAVLAAQAELHERLKKLEGKKRS